MGKVRLVLVDDHEVVRIGLLALLEDLPWVEVVAEAGTAVEAVAAVVAQQPDVVIMDIRLPGESGIEACATIKERWPWIEVVMLTSFADDDLIFRALEAGASGYVLKQVGNESLVQALEAVRRGEALLDPMVTKRVIARMREGEQQRHAAAFHDLSDREMEVLLAVAHGKTNAEIGEQLVLSEKTVRNHLTSILSKLELSNRIEAATYAISNDIQHHMPGGAGR